MKAKRKGTRRERINDNREDEGWMMRAKIN